MEDTLHEPIVDPAWLFAARARERALVEARRDRDLALDFWAAGRAEREDRARRARDDALAPQARRAAAARPFPPLFLFEAQELADALGPGVTVWLVGHGDRTYLRLVHLPPVAHILPAMRLGSGAPVRPVPAGRPFALDEMHEDRVYELEPGLDEGESLHVHDRAFTLGPPKQPEGRTDAQRDLWIQLAGAYHNDLSRPERERRRSFKTALRALLFVVPKDGAAKTPKKPTPPRLLRPWSLLTLSMMAAEIATDPGLIKPFGLDLLARHPQCFGGLQDRLRAA